MKIYDHSGIKTTSYTMPFVLQNAFIAAWFGYIYAICTEVEDSSWKYSVLHEMSALTQNVGLVDPSYIGAAGLVGLSMFNMSYVSLSFLVRA